MLQEDVAMAKKRYFLMTRVCLIYRYRANIQKGNLSIIRTTVYMFSDRLDNWHISSSIVLLLLSALIQWRSHYERIIQRVTSITIHRFASRNSSESWTTISMDVVSLLGMSTVHPMTQAQVSVFLILRHHLKITSYVYL